MIAPALTGWLVETLVASTILMAAVLLLRTPVRRAFGPDIAYALWALPLLRMLLPPLPASWHAVATAAAGETITIYLVAPLGQVASSSSAGAALLVPAIAALWLLGAAAFLLWHAAAHLCFCRRMLVMQVRATRIDGGIRLIETEAASGPLAFGIWRRYVAFPRDFAARYDQDERDLALAHELGHHARGDLIANWAALAVLALHWFNPVAWRAFRAFRADQEIANDARVLAGLSPMARHAYACAIVKSAHGGAVSAACHLHTIDDLKGRLKMLTTDRTSRSRMIGGAAAIAVLTLAGLGVTASGTQAAETVRSRVEQATGVNLAQFQVAPPAPPVAPAGSELPEPPAPPAPPVVATTSDTTSDTTTVTDGRIVKRIKFIRADKDGKMVTEDWQGMGELKDMPEITSMKCPTGDAKQLVMNEEKGGKRKIVICTNRIATVAAEGAAVAANSADIERNALQSAMSGLRSARAGIESESGMTAEQRAQSLAAIDQAIKEVTEQMGKAN